MSSCHPGPGYCQCLIAEEKAVRKCQRGPSFSGVPVLALRIACAPPGIHGGAFPLGSLLSAQTIQVFLSGWFLCMFPEKVIDLGVVGPLISVLFSGCLGFKGVGFLLYSVGGGLFWLWLQVLPLPYTKLFHLVSTVQTVPRYSTHQRDWGWVCPAPRLSDKKLLPAQPTGGGGLKTLPRKEDHHHHSEPDIGEKAAARLQVTTILCTSSYPAGLKALHRNCGEAVMGVGDPTWSLGQNGGDTASRSLWPAGNAAEKIEDPCARCQCGLP